MTSDNNNQSNDNLEKPSHDDSKLMIDKEDVIKTLQKLIDEYPSETVPRSVVRQALMKIAGPSGLGDLSEHPSLKKLDDLINKAKTF